MAPPESYVFLDTETTGFPWQENNRTRVTELAMVAVHRDHMLAPGETPPRLLLKLVLCFSPDRRIPPAVTRVTGLNNQILDYVKPFSKKSAQLIKAFLDTLASPVCLVAHNGNKFDYPILQAELDCVQEAFNDNILCVDSLEMFRSHLGSKQIVYPQAVEDVFTQDSGFSESDLAVIENIEKQYSNNDEILAPFIPCDNVPILVEAVKSKGKISYKLGEIYKRLYGKETDHLHRAESDCMTLLHCCKAKVDDFVEWSNRNSIVFNTIPRMEPGKKFPPTIPGNGNIADNLK